MDAAEVGTEGRRMTIADAEWEMRNWARWAHAGESPAVSVVSAIWAMWLPFKHRDVGWGEAAAPDAIPDPIDEAAAQATDAKLRRLGRGHLQTLRLHYFRHRGQHPFYLGAALRALHDLDQNRNHPRPSGGFHGLAKP